MRSHFAGFASVAIAGNFYGANAAETAGVFSASGGGNALWGSYGAK